MLLISSRGGGSPPIKVSLNPLNIILILTNVTIEISYSVKWLTHLSHSLIWSFKLSNVKASSSSYKFRWFLVFNICYFTIFIWFFSFMLWLYVWILRLSKSMSFILGKIWWASSNVSFSDSPVTRIECSVCCRRIFLHHRGDIKPSIFTNGRVLGDQSLKSKHNF